jgi:hypothetical protein
MQSVCMKTSIELDDELRAEIERTGSRAHKDPATVLQMAIRAGLPLVSAQFRANPPEGYFADDYPLPAERLALENAMSRTVQVPDR